MSGTRAARLLALARLDFADVRRSRWLAFCGALYAVLAGLFVLVGLRQSSVLGFTGTGRVLLSLSHTLVLLLPLLALTATGQVVNRARDDGTLELLFSHPFSRRDYYLALSLVRFTVLLAPLILLMLAVAILGLLLLGSAIPWGYLGRCVLVCAALLWAFTGLGLVVTVTVRNQARAIMVLLALWVLGVALLDFGLIGLMLRWRLHARTVFALAALNPVEAARLGLLVSAEPSLSILGPVGFYLAQRLGAGWVEFTGIAWPAIVGTTAWWAARRRFSRGDLV
jgi:ABC-2 type transport system permease protein